MSIRRNRPISPFSYAGKGFVSCKDGIVTISTTDQTENRSTAFTVADGRVEVATRNVKEERLKAADRDEADELGVFAEEFVKAQRRILPRRKTLSEGDRVTITGIREDAEGQLWCRPTGDDAEEMALFNDELIVGTEVRDLIPYLYANDFITGARVESDADGLGISIRRSYLAFASQEAEIAHRNKHFFQGRVLYVNEQMKRILWMTACGFFGISRIREGVEEGDEAVLYVVSIVNRDEDCFINVDVDETGGAGQTVQPFDEESLLEAFIQTEAPAEAESRPDGSERVL